MKNTLVALGLVVSLAMFALPAAAAFAGTWHLEPVGGGATGPNFAITIGAWAFSTAGGTYTLKGTSISGSATFDKESTTTGTIDQVSAGVTGGLKFTGVTSLGFPCTSPGQTVPGTVLTTPLTFHLEKIDTETPGILLKPNGGGVEPNHFANLSCGGLPSILRGNGLFGDVTNKCGEETEKGTAVFQTNGESGQQKYKQVTTTGTSYDLEAGTNVGATWTTAALEMPATLTFAKSKLNCTLP